jgi:hypothetical protein
VPLLSAVRVLLPHRVGIPAHAKRAVKGCQRVRCINHAANHATRLDQGGPDRITCRGQSEIQLQPDRGDRVWVIWSKLLGAAWLLACGAVILTRLSLPIAELLSVVWVLAFGVGGAVVAYARRS